MRNSTRALLAETWQLLRECESNARRLGREEVCKKEEEEKEEKEAKKSQPPKVQEQPVGDLSFTEVMDKRDKKRGEPQAKKARFEEKRKQKAKKT